MLLDKRTAIHAYDFTSGEGLSQYLCGTGIVFRLGVGRVEHSLVHNQEVGVGGRKTFAVFVIDGFGHGQRRSLPRRRRSAGAAR